MILELIVLILDRYLGEMLAKSKTSEERTEWSRKFIELYTTILELLPG